MYTGGVAVGALAEQEVPAQRRLRPSLQPSIASWPAMVRPKSAPLPGQKLLVGVGAALGQPLGPPCAVPYAGSGWKTPTSSSAPQCPDTSSAFPAHGSSSRRRAPLVRCTAPVETSAHWWAPLSPGLSCRARSPPSLLETSRLRKNETPRPPLLPVYCPVPLSPTALADKLFPPPPSPLPPHLCTYPLPHPRQVPGVNALRVGGGNSWLLCEGVFGVPWPLQFPSPLLGLALLLRVVGGEVPLSSLRRGLLEIRSL